MSYDAVVFAGGGCRCAWQAGFWRAAGSELAPRVVSAVSAGAAFACAALSGIGDDVIDDFARRVAENPGNVHLKNALVGKRVFPHAEMFRSAVLANIDQDTLDVLHRGPEIRVLLAHPPTGFAVAPWLLAGLAAYKLDRLARRRVHVRWPRRLGFRVAQASVSECDTPEQLADLLLQSSCTPPVTPLLRRDGRVVVDGGIIDSVPVELVADSSAQLVLLTRRYAADLLPDVPGRTYVQPSRPLRISAWDYANPTGLRDAYELGRADGERFADTMASS